jgi:hypothetical protein
MNGRPDEVNPVTMHRITTCICHDSEMTMGFPISRCVCSRCGKVEPGWIWSPRRMYQLEHGRQIAVNYCYGWCFSCDGIQHVEDLTVADSMASLRRISTSLRSASTRRRWFTKKIVRCSFHKLDDGCSIAHEASTADFHAMGEVIETACEQINYLLNRIAPPRCLKCGSHDITTLTGMRDDETGETRGWRHPGCDGIFRISEIGRWNLTTCKVKLIYKDDGMFSHEEMDKVARER